MLPLSKDLVEAIQKLAEAAREEFPKAYSEWLGRTTSLGSTKLGHQLSVIAQNGLLAETGCTLQQLIGHLKVIKGFSKSFIHEDKTFISFVQEVKQALELLTPASEKRSCSITTAYPDSIIDLVGIEKSVACALEAHIHITNGELSFSDHIADKLDDTTLEYLLKQKSQMVKDARTFDFAKYPSLSVRAPALVLESCPKIEPACFKSLVKDPRFLDHTIILVSEKQQRTIPVNKGLLAHYSHFFAKLIVSPLGSNKRKTAVSITESMNDETADYLSTIIRMEEFKDLDIVKAIKAFKIADYYCCPLVMKQAVTFIINAVTSDYKTLGQIYAFVEEYRLSLGDDAKKLEDSLFTEVTNRLQDSASAAIQRFSFHLEDFARNELMCYYLNKELGVMAKVPSFPFPPDLLTRLKLDKTIECGVNFQELLGNLDAIAAALACPQIQELPQEQELSTDAIAAPAPSLLDDDSRYELFREKVLQEIASFHITFSAKDNEKLFLHFAYLEVAEMIRVGTPPPSSFVTKLGLKELAETAITTCNALTQFPRDLVNLLKIFDESNLADARIPYLLGKIYAGRWLYNEGTKSLARASFSKALQIDPEFADARLAIEALSSSILDGIFDAYRYRGYQRYYNNQDFQIFNVEV